MEYTFEAYLERVQSNYYDEGLSDLLPDSSLKTKLVAGALAVTLIGGSIAWDRRTIDAPTQGKSITINVPKEYLTDNFLQKLLDPRRVTVQVEIDPNVGGPKLTDSGNGKWILTINRGKESSEIKRDFLSAVRNTKNYTWADKYMHDKSADERVLDNTFVNTK